MKHRIIKNSTRHIDTSKPVQVYRNLNQGCYSVKQAGVVVAWLDEVELASVRFQVSEAGRKRCLKEQRKNVHAFVVGTFLAGYLGGADKPEGDFVPVRYNPFQGSSFVNQNSGAVVTEAAFISLAYKSALAVL